MRRILALAVALALPVAACAEPDSSVDSSSEDITQFHNPREDKGAMPQATGLTVACRDKVVESVTNIVTSEADQSYPNVSTDDDSLPEKVQAAIAAYLHYFPDMARVSVKLRGGDYGASVLVVDDASDDTGSYSVTVVLAGDTLDSLQLAVVGNEQSGYSEQEWFCGDDGSAAAEPLDTTCVGLMARSLPSPKEYKIADAEINGSIDEVDAFLSGHSDGRVRELALPVYRDFADAVLQPDDEVRVSVGGWATIDERRAAWLTISYKDATSGDNYNTGLSITESARTGAAYALVQHGALSKPQQYICEAAASK